MARAGLVLCRCRNAATAKHSILDGHCLRARRRRRPSRSILRSGAGVFACVYAYSSIHVSALAVAYSVRKCLTFSLVYLLRICLARLQPRHPGSSLCISHLYAVGSVRRPVCHVPGFAFAPFLKTLSLFFASTIAHAVCMRTAREYKYVYVCMYVAPWVTNTYGAPTPTAVQ